MKDLEWQLISSWPPKAAEHIASEDTDVPKESETNLMRIHRFGRQVYSIHSKPPYKIVTKWQAFYYFVAAEDPLRGTASIWSQRTMLDDEYSIDRKLSIAADE